MVQNGMLPDERLNILDMSKVHKLACHLDQQYDLGATVALS